MIPKDIIRLMTKLAVYDKKHGEADRKTAEYFSNDYVYRKNSGARFYAFLGSIIVLFFYWLHKLVIDQVDLFTLDYKRSFVGCLIFIGTVMVVYTLISSQKAMSEYNEAKRRLKNYFVLLGKLDRAKDEAYAGGEEASNRGADFLDPGNDH